MADLQLQPPEPSSSPDIPSYPHENLPLEDDLPQSQPQSNVDQEQLRGQLEKVTLSDVSSVAHKCS